MKTISLVLPIYNEEKNIDAFYAELKKTLNSISKYNKEIIFINDGSKDTSLQKLETLALQDNSITVISFSRNFGHQMAITAGLDYVKGDSIIIMDTDLQDPPSLIPQLIHEWENGFDVVYATRKSRKDTWFKKVTADLFYRLINILSDVAIPRNTGDFRLMDRKVVNELNKFREKARFLRGLSCFVGFNQTKVLFDRSERVAGETNYPIRKMIRFSIDAITGFSSVPLKLIGNIGGIVAGLSFLGIVYALILKFFFPAITVSGWTMLIISILFMGGIQMIMLGVIGSYVGRIYDEVRNRPLYIISKIIKNK